MVWVGFGTLTKGRCAPKEEREMAARVRRSFRERKGHKGGRLG